MPPATDGFTHYAWYDRPGFTPTSWVQAVCGTHIRRRDSDPEPTCPRCRAILTTHDNGDRRQP